MTWKLYLVLLTMSLLWPLTTSADFVLSALNLLSYATLYSKKEGSRPDVLNPILIMAQPNEHTINIQAW